MQALQSQSPSMNGKPVIYGDTAHWRLATAHPAFLDIEETV
jgi:hypothetical protein